jgi:ligand-binding sensor domain-containing protein/signal transduction histidine kinase
MSWLLALAASAALVAPSAAPKDYTVDRWTVEDGLPNNALSDVIQSRDGYLWISTWAGTVRFDGVRFTRTAEDLPNDHARVLLEDRDGAMWIGVGGGGLARLRAGRVVQVFTTSEGLAGNDVRALAEDADGRIWAGTENGVSVIASGRVTTFRAPRDLPGNTITALARGRDGRIWLATPDGLCDARALQLTCAPPGAFIGRPNAILEDRAGRRWIGTDAGLFSIGGDAGAPCGGVGCFTGREVSALLEGRDGGIWVGLADSSVTLIRDREVRSFGPADGLPAGGPVVSLYEDVEGSVWVATYNGGLGRLKPKRVAMFSTSQGLAAKVVGSVVQDAAGTIWAGAQCGPVSEFHDGRFVPRFAEHTKDACAWTLWPARDGALWIGTRGRGLFRWAGGRMAHFGRENGLSDEFICGLFEDREGRLWIGTELGGLHVYADGHLSRAYGAADGVATHDLASFAQDREGRVWIGSNANGLSVFEGGTFRTLRGEEAPPSGNIAGLLVDSRGDLWIGTAARGLFRRRNGRYEPFSVDQGLGDRLIAVLLEDRAGTLWVGTARGISRLDRDRIDAVADGRRASLDPIILDRSDGMLNTEGSGGGLDPSGLVDRDGRLWFSTIDGIAVVDPATFRTNQIAPRVLVEGASLGGRAAERRRDGRVDVPAGTTSIEVSYTAFSFLAPHKVRFRYRLRGFDREWQDVETRRTAYYSALPPGAYTFEVLAANNDGLWSTTPATMALVVAPFWYERRPVQAAAIALLLVLGAVVVRRVSLRRARARLAELEREQALDRERSRIARDLHDDLGSRLTYIAMIADAPGASDRESRLARAARDAVQTMDELVWAVNARNDSVESFVYYLAQFAEEHIVAAGVRCRLLLPPDLPARTLAADVRRHLYLACKEAVNNAVKHAQATEIRVALRVDGDTLVVEVVDDGRGLSKEAMDPTGNGLKNYRERMDAVGGTLAIESAAGRGTRIVFTIPL